MPTNKIPDIVPPANLVSKKSYHVPGMYFEPWILVTPANLLLGKLHIIEYFFRVPVDYRNPKNGQITLFARSATNFEKPLIQKYEEGRDRQKPFFCYLQGGPGFGNREPWDSPITRYVLNRGYQVLFLDYRGVGLSTPITAATLALQGDEKAQAEYLKFFRADSNVADLEAVRLCLTADFAPEKKAWSILGQSFGGFVSLTYLSFRPQGLREVFLAGGLAPINMKAETVYKATADRVSRRNRVYYSKYPEDRHTVFELATYLKETPVALPSGGTLSAERLLSLGVLFGFHRGLDDVHSIIVRMNADKTQFGFLTRPTLALFEKHLTFDTHPIYAILHEAIYNYSPGMSSNWAAYRVLQSDPRFSWVCDAKQSSSPQNEYQKPLYFSGEMILPHHFDTYSELLKMKGVADILAKATDWGTLYDIPTLEQNTVPVYAASYVDDMYVDYYLAKQTAAKIKGIKTFETNIMYHDAIRAKDEAVFSQLFTLRDDSID